MLSTRHVRSVPCLLPLALAACGTGSVEPAAETVAVERGEFPLTVTGSAELRAGRETTIHSEVEGKRTVMHLVGEGVLAEEGQILVELDASEVRDKRSEQAIALARAEGALARAETDPERAALEAELAIRKERIAHLDAQIGRAVVRAPIPGLVVYARGIREGAVVREQQPLLYLADLGSLQARMRVGPSGLEQLALGQRTTLRTDVFPDLAVSGRVVAIEPADASGERWVIVDVADEYPGLRPHMSAKAAIEVGELRDVLTVPVQCIQVAGGAPTLWRQAAQGAEPVAVEIVAEDGSRAVVRGGLAAGDRILLAPPR